MFVHSISAVVVYWVIKIQKKSDRVEALNASCRFILILEYIPLTLPFPEPMYCYVSED